MPLPKFPKILQILPCLTGLLDGAHNSTFDGLFSELAGPEPAPLGSSLVLRSVLAHAEKPFATLVNDPWGLAALHRALIELRRAGITSRALGEGSPSVERTRLANVLALYEQGLAHAGVRDGADRDRDAVLAVIERRLPWMWHAIDSVRVQGVAELFGSRLDLIGAFASMGLDVEITLPWDSARPESFVWSEASLHALETRGHRNIRVAFDDRVGTGPLATMRRSLMTRDVVEGAPARVMRVSGAQAHARRVAHEVMVWIDRGIAPECIAVACAEHGELTTQVRQALALGNIPIRDAAPPTLLQTPMATALLSLLRMPDRAFPREDLLEVLYALNVSIPVGEDLMHIDSLARLLRVAGVRSAAFAGGYGAALDALPRGDEISHGLSRVFTLMQRLPEAASLGTHLCALTTLVNELCRGGSRTALEEECMDVIHASQRLLIDLQPEIRDQHFSRSEVAAWLARVLSQTPINGKSNHPGGVYVCTPSDLIGRSYSHVVIAGVNAGTFPAKPRPDPILSDSLRAEINRVLGPRLLQLGGTTGRGPMRSDARDLWVWIEAMHAVEQEILVTTMSGAGEETLERSELVDDLLRVLAMEPEVPRPVEEEARNYRMSPMMHQRTAHRGILRDVDLHTMIVGNTQTTSGMDTLATCNFKYVSAHLLKLRVDDVPRLGVDAREEGILVHAALHVVYDDLRKHGGFKFLRVEPEKCLMRARHVFEQHQQRLLADVSVHPYLQETLLEEAWGMLELQLRADMNAGVDDELLALEYRFDERADVAPIFLRDPESSEGIRVRGSIDRIERKGDTVWALDYKRTIIKREPGRHLQLPIYATVARRDFSNEQDLVDVAWIGLKDAKRKAPVDSGEGAEGHVDDAARVLWSRLVPLLQGELRADAEDLKTCTMCDHRFVCQRFVNGGGADV